MAVRYLIRPHSLALEFFLELDGPTEEKHAQVRDLEIGSVDPLLTMQRFIWSVN